MSRNPDVSTRVRRSRLVVAVVLGAAGASLVAGQVSAAPLRHHHHRHAHLVAPVVAAPVEPVYDESDNFPVSPPDLFGDGAGGEQTPGRGSYGLFGLGPF